jgi:hypothetical protein
VTVIFDNRDTKRSPVGYEQYQEITVTRQVVIGGRNKYLINGVTAQLGRVQNLFHSVQLNVNNPHFLIMQGRITKVINMKPPEVRARVSMAVRVYMCVCVCPCGYQCTCVRACASAPEGDKSGNAFNLPGFNHDRFLA